ncbi:T9SS type B sorting domain-containing protein [Marinirhabdus gelatinilytica]|uniref:Gliding motility-associated-like protein n=1 Tax=Marinirhabdus gelatinilytica TaxID=1703343 RepID=A0A370QFU3_9FLAO|nr:gliding motility-associated C-terminal domain-containing protein [Marinirhabdus gelatinilytica]RDK86910.1 gliding motility-associated-like protein [Marinirhabdus gelatinilytica]
MKNRYLLSILLLITCVATAQEIGQFQQFNGRFDYTGLGNTLNLAENNGNAPCEILTESSADLTLQPGQTVVAAALYWAGSGEGDFEVALNGNPIISERNFSYIFDNGTTTYNYFAAYADVTSIVAATLNGTYTLSELDLTEDIIPFCSANGGTGTNFGGWAMYVIYEDASLPLNQIILFDGLEGVSASNPQINILLEDLNVLDNTGAKIGFLAWEGDQGIAVNETLSINGNILSNPPLNPSDNQFNGTNSFTGSNVLYNMDLDVYSIENNINPGDTTADIQVTSGQDLVMINNIITVLNVELPDATIMIDEVTGADDCGDRDITVDYTVFNVNSTGELPANTPIAFYANSSLVGQAATTMVLPIDGSESGTIDLTIPEAIPADFLLSAFVDDTGGGVGIVNELDETNNGFTVEVSLKVFPDVSNLEDLEQCDVVGTETFDLTEATENVTDADTITFHLTEDDAQNDIDPIPNPGDYENIENPQTIWVRASNPDCFSIGSFMIEITVCPLPDATIAITNNLNACRQRDLTIMYTVFNTLGTAPLPANTPIAFYLDGTLVAQAETENEIPEGGSEPGVLVLTLSPNVPNTFTLLLVVDDDGTGNGVVFELDDTNNTFEIDVTFGEIPPIGPLPDILECDQGNDMAQFDLTENEELISTNNNDTITYFTSEEDAIANINPILDPELYTNTSDPQEIFVRLENEICFTIASFLLETENCEPTIPEGMSPNGDGLNDVFKIQFLLDVFPDFNLKIYSRHGNLIYEGGNEDGLWDGIPNTGILQQDKVVPVGVYFYVLQLNDPQFPDAYLGDLYVNY